jgi:acetolactate synthase-1/2/3 large subunit
MKIKKGMRVFSNQGCASMGYDLPAAIGACFARDRKPVVLITGDGSIQMNIQELQTIVSHKLPLKIFVLNNQGYLAIRTSQDAYFQGRYYASCGRGGVSCPDICRVAEAYGIPAIKMSSGKNIITVIKKALAFKGPVVCEVFMDPKQTLFPKLSSEVSPDGRLISHPLEDMYPFLERQEFKRHMIIKPVEEKINECA